MVFFAKYLLGFPTFRVIIRLLYLYMGVIIMADKTKFKSIGIDADTHQKLKRICDDERRNIRQQISIWVDADYNDRYKEDDNVTRLGLGKLNN
jgi:ABC-type oligopeptide transport system ATPase subunit